MVCKIVVIIIQISTVAGQIASKYQNSRDIPTISPYPKTGPGYKFLLGKVQTQYHGQTFRLGREPRFLPYYLPFPPGLLPTTGPYLTPGRGYTYHPGKVPTQYPGQTYQPGKEPTLSPYKPFPPDLRLTISPNLTPGPGYTYPPGKVPTQYPGQTFPPGKEPTLSPYKPFPPNLLPTLGPYLTPGLGYTYPPNKVPTQYPGQTFAPGKAPTLYPYFLFPPGLRPTPGPTNAQTKKPYLISTAIPGISTDQGVGVNGNKVSTEPSLILPSYETFPPDLPFTAFFKPLGPYTSMTLKPGKVISLYTELGQPPTLGSVPNLTPEPQHITPKGKVLIEYPVGLTFPPDLLPTFQPYATPGIWDLYPEEKVPTPYPYLTFPPAKEPLLIPDYYYPPPDLRPTFRPYATPGIWNLNPKEKVPTPYPVTLTFPPLGKEPAIGYTYSQHDLVPTFRPYATPGIWNLYPQEKVPTPFPVIVTSPPPGKEQSMQTYKPFPSVFLPTLAAYLISAVGYTYPPPGKKPTYYGARFPSDYRSTTEPTNAPTNAPTKRTYIKSTTIPAIITGQGVNGGVCIFDGVSYKQGQQWYDLCSSVCVCEDASTGYYRCKPRCSKNDGVSKGCFMVPDPKDPSCCQIPDCSFVLPDIFPTPSNRITKLAPTTLDWFAAPTIIITLSILASVMLISGIALIVQYFRLRKKLPDATTYLPEDELKVERNIENYETTDMKQKLIFIDEI